MKQSLVVARDVQVDLAVRETSLKVFNRLMDIPIQVMLLAVVVTLEGAGRLVRSAKLRRDADRVVSGFERPDNWY